MSDYAVYSSSTANNEAQSQFAVKWKAVRDAGGDADQMLLYPPGASEAEKTRIWKERKKAKKEAEKEAKKLANTRGISEGDTVHGSDKKISGSGEDKNRQSFCSADFSKETEATDPYSGILGINEGKKGSKLQRIKGLFSRAERGEHIVH